MPTITSRARDGNCNTFGEHQIDVWIRLYFPYLRLLFSSHPILHRDFWLLGGIIESILLYFFLLSLSLIGGKNLFVIEVILPCVFFWNTSTAQLGSFAILNLCSCILFYSEIGERLYPKFCSSVSLLEDISHVYCWRMDFRMTLNIINAKNILKLSIQVYIHSPQLGKSEEIHLIFLNGYLQKVTKIFNRMRSSQLVAIDTLSSLNLSSLL